MALFKGEWKYPTEHFAFSITNAITAVQMARMQTQHQQNSTRNDTSQIHVEFNKLMMRTLFFSVLFSIRPRIVYNKMDVVSAECIHPKK